MPDPSYVVETQGRAAGLSFHLETAFYPPLPLYTRTQFIKVFERYWGYEIDIDQLSNQLRQDAGYTGSLNDYNFWQFLNEEDFE